MKKILFSLAVLLIALPVSADVTISCANDPCCGWLTISYDDGGGELIRGFALDISTGNEVKIIDVNDNVNDDFTIYPGSIDISPSGEIVDDGQSVADGSALGACGGLDSNCITIEMVSLYVGAGNAPPASGVLLRLQVDGDCTLWITGNAVRGNVVLEDFSKATIVSSGCEIDEIACHECYDDGGPVPGTYQNWVDVGKPGSWCCAYQHLGDCNGNALTQIQDLMVCFKPSYNSAHPAAEYNPDADCNRDKAINIKDLMQCFKPNYNKAHQPGYDCEYDTW